ncbi:MAG TPA: AbrB/MazE/SpoVT family DNA-binding domain-containing protein [Gammaproteobacteria bacterium]|nr:AbrB/MazE/SpoVT family DNA-binding domain-containing protein [Gammaproteobacteria bacterium]
MAKVKVRKVGNSLGVLLPREVLNRLQIREGDELVLSEDGDGLLLSPFDPDFAAALEALEQARRRYRNAMRELAR